GTALQIQVTNSDGTANMQNVAVTFSAPTSGASGTFTGGSTSATVNTDSSGLATAPTFTANSTQGGYAMQVKLGAVTSAVSFSLTNTVPVNVAPSITTNPTNQTVNAGQTATFTAAATGTPTPTVQWQVSTNGGTSFSDISGATST